MIEYESQGNSYKSDIFVDLEHYMTFYSTNTDEDEILKSIKNISVELKSIKKALENHSVEINDGKDA